MALFGTYDREFSKKNQWNWQIKNAKERFLIFGVKCLFLARFWSRPHRKGFVTFNYFRSWDPLNTISRSHKFKKDESETIKKYWQLLSVKKDKYRMQLNGSMIRWKLTFMIENGSKLPSNKKRSTKYSINTENQWDYIKDQIKMTEIQLIHLWLNPTSYWLVQKNVEKLTDSMKNSPEKSAWELPIIYRWKSLLKMWWSQWIKYIKRRIHHATFFISPWVANKFSRLKRPSISDQKLPNVRVKGDRCVSFLMSTHWIIKPFFYPHKLRLKAFMICLV